MNTQWMERTRLLVGEDGLKKLNQAHVLIAGMGGVGSFAAEFIARAGVGKMTIIDGDIVDPTNRNRQLPALATTHGLPKAQLMKERILQINPEIQLVVYEEFMTPERAHKIINTDYYSYIIDAIDSVTPKLYFLEAAYYRKLPLISSMGAGGKLDPTALQVVDISQTHTCPFAQYVRKRLRKIGIRNGIQTVFSTEHVIKKSLMLTDGRNFKKSAYGTISYLPATFGSVCASVAIRGIIQQN
ncbi:MAG: tRNA threonylcarbamoyladenosine dehydratase [Flavobacteriales bacterium]|nr:tRNA threonylcarbamoyladenosine dehydratase [Flavobacteriales bacterium]